MRKDIVQEEALQKWKTAGYNGLVLLAPGMGKTKITLDAIEAVYKDIPKAKDLRPELRDKYIPILVLTSNSDIRDVTFPREMEKWDFKYREEVQVQCYQTVYKWEGYLFGLVIADEVDFAFTPEYIKCFTRNKSRFFLGLSATAPQEKIQLALDEGLTPKKAKVIMRFSVNKAQEVGLLNKAKLVIHPVKLSSAKTLEYKGSILSENELYALVQAELDRQYKWRNEIWERLKNVGRRAPNNMESITLDRIKKKINWLAAGHGNNFSRRELLLNSIAVTDYVTRLKRWLLESDPMCKVLLLAERKSVLKEISDHFYFSDASKKMDDAMKQDFEAFLKGDLRELACISQKIGRGINFATVDDKIVMRHAIVINVTGSMVKFVQTDLGRMVRLNVNETAYIHMIIPTYVDPTRMNEGVKETQTSVWLNNALEKSGLDIPIITRNEFIQDFNEKHASIQQ